MDRRQRTALLLAGLSFLLYLANLRVMGAGDSVPARWIPFSFLRQGNVDLDEFAWLRDSGGVPYYLRYGRDEHWHSRYPVAAPLAAVPFYLPAFAWTTIEGIAPEDVRFRVAGVVSERIAAAAMAAASVALLYLALCTQTGTGFALAIAVVYAAGTSTWSTSSQALWQHGLVQLCLAGLSYCFLRPGARGLHFAGAFTAAMVAARPMMIVFALLALVFVWRRRRADLVSFLMPALAGAALLLWYNVGSHGRISGAYTPKDFALPAFERFFGLLLSPSRGLFVYTPLALLAAGALRPARLRRGDWIASLAAGTGAYVLLFTCFERYWGGFSYGPRFFTDVLPALALCAAAPAQRLWQRRPWRFVLAGAAAWGLMVQIAGVYFDDGGWNREPVSVDEQPGRVWHWRDPQILRAFAAGWHGTELAPLLRQSLVEPRPALLRPLPVPLPAQFELVEPLAARPWSPGEARTLRVRIVNRGDEAWPAFTDVGHYAVGVEVGWWGVRRAETPSGYVLDEQGTIRASVEPLPRNLYPGDDVTLPLRVRAPETPGRYRLKLRLSQQIGRMRPLSPAPRLEEVVDVG